ncbi:Heat shock protein, chloroplastic [Tetrabaena socialis]|uniref:Heat shock protein, chloroplastic n=1 Tax=Tetrabaena socialis TaxID=47790 RepID=A0A2J8A1Q0_9CHLO|nr:Heat shock protein, chloroplastic [Tetrabaena socialis]|eukprot:PNH06434.1 Heat shock protein, chloroplastic [Tetrabaena socialis]
MAAQPFGTLMAMLPLLMSDPFFADVDPTLSRFAPHFGQPLLPAAHPARAGLPATLDLFRPSSAAAALGGSPAVDIVETGSAYELHADAPGMAPEDVKVELTDRRLTVSGQRKVEHEDKDAQGKVWRRERAAYSFARSFTLPDNADPEGISASIEQGVLKVTVPKREAEPQPEPKRIAVQACTPPPSAPAAA